MVILQRFLCLWVILLSSCAVVQESGDLVLTKKVQSAATLSLQSDLDRGQATEEDKKVRNG